MTEQQKNQYQTIIQARNFHYEQFTRWSSYFYVIIGALLMPVIPMFQSDMSHNKDLRLLENNK